MSKIDVYQNCPIIEIERFILRLVKESDAEELLECYSNTKSQRFFNADYCTNDFCYTSLDEMQECIRFWLECYKTRGFVRFAIIDRIQNKAVGTMEMFCGKSWLNGLDGGCLRLDILPEYETENHIFKLVNMANTNFFELFGAEFIVIKAIPEATERITALKRAGYTPFVTDEEHRKHYYGLARKRAK